MCTFRRDIQTKIMFHCTSEVCPKTPLIRHPMCCSRESRAQKRARTLETGPSQFPRIHAVGDVPMVRPSQHCSKSLSACQGFPFPARRGPILTTRPAGSTSPREWTDLCDLCALTFRTSENDPFPIGTNEDKYGDTFFPFYRLTARIKLHKFPRDPRESRAIGRERGRRARGRPFAKAAAKQNGVQRFTSRLIGDAGPTTGFSFSKFPER